jgi:hypothetical protein
VSTGAVLANGRPQKLLDLLPRPPQHRTALEAREETPPIFRLAGLRILRRRQQLGQRPAAIERHQAIAERVRRGVQRDREPERYRGYYGAATAAARSGDKAKAKQYFTALVKLAGQGSPRPETAEARAFLGANP